MKKLLYCLSFSMIVSSSWSQTPSGCFSSGNDISFSKAFGSGSRGIVKGDFDNDGLLDVVVSLYAGSVANNNYAFLKGLGNGKFDTPIAGFASAVQTNHIVSADFNSDGKLDIALTNIFSNSVTIQLGNGDGTFGTATPYTVNAPRNMALGDINEDGAIDIVVTTSSISQTLLGSVGTPGTFTSGPTFNIAGTIADIRLADMNGDNHLDVVSVGTAGVGVSINNSGSLGTFANAVLYPSGANPFSLTLCDIDNDNDMDVINSNKNANTISVKKNNGSGVLDVAIIYSTGTGPEGVEHADINGDGNEDIVVVNDLAATMSIFYGSSSGTLTLHQTTQCPGSPRTLVIGNFNADSHLDIITAQLTGAFVNSYLGNSSNNYLLPDIYPTGNAPKSISSNDFNGDGKKDLVVANSANNNFQLFTGNGAGAFTSAGTFASGTLPSSIISGDLDGDGDMDVVTANFTSNNISIFYGNGSGGFSAASNISVQTGPIQVRMGSLNGDAYPDLVVANQTTGSISVILSSGAGTYNAPVHYPTSATTSAICITDINGDTYKDVLVGHNVATTATVIKFTNNGSGAFTNSGNVGTAQFSNITAMEATDLDGDADPDIVMSCSSAIVKIYNVNGGGAATALSTSIGSGISPGRDVAILDINSDGKNDVAAIYSPSSQSGQLVISMASSTGPNTDYSLTNGPRSFACEVGSAGMATGDFNGDGRIDIAVVNEVSNSLNIHFNTTPKITAGGPLSFCNGNSVALTSTPALWYDWDPNGETTQAISATTSGTYYTTTSSSWSNWCSSSSNSLVVSVAAGPSAPTVTAGGPTTFCSGGSVVLTSSQSTGNQWYKNGNIIPGATNSTYTATTAGDYTVTYTNAGCTSPQSSIITITTSQTPVITAGGPTTFCSGGSVTLTSNVGTNITWSNGATTPSITVNTGGTYSVTNTVGACPPLISNSIVVTVGSSLSTPSISPSGSISLCSGNTVTLTSSSATNNIWSTGATSQSIVVSAAGTYSVHLDNGSCTSSNSSPVTVTISSPPSAPTITASGATTFCTGGSVTLTSSAGNSYLWSNGATTQSITVSTAGSYTVQVTNASTCQSAASAPTTVTVNTLPATPTITASGATTFCTGGSVTLTSSAGNSYLWSNGATTQSITVSTAGSYTVQVTNASTCQSAASAPTTVTVNALPATPTVTAGGATTFCTGGSVTLTSSTGNSYLWSNGATTQSITVTTSGSYTVQVTNASTCQSAASAPTTVTVNALPATPTIMAGGTTTFCAGGSVTLTSSAGNSYLWSNGETTQSITVTTSGSYTVQVTNASTCQSAASAPTTVTVNALPATPTITAGGATTFCAGGSVTLTSSAGNSYLWSNGATTQSITVTTSGSYTVQVTNASTCQSAASAPTIVTVNALPATPTITAGGATTFCTGGSVTLTSSAGNSYLWSNGATTQSITVSTPGSYTVQVTNASTCQSAASAPTIVTVNALPATPTITAGGATTFCTGGSVTLTSSAGNSYLWSNGATTQSITVTTSGSYTVQVTNASTCQSAASAPTTVTVNALPATPTITASGSTAICAGSSITLTSSTGTSYLWSTGETTQSISVSTAGSYTVQITDASTCQSAVSTPTTVTVNPLPAPPTITAGGATTFCAGGSVTLTSSAGNSYLWSNGETTQSITVTTAGSYTVQVTNAASCQSSSSSSTTIIVNPAPTAPIITAGGATTFCDGGTVTLVSSAGVSHLWSTGETGSSINVTSSGSYTVQITDANGCQSPSSAATTVTVNALPATPVITSSGSTTICDEESVTLTSSPGTTYLWSTGETTQSIVVTDADSYTVQVTNAATCQSAASATTNVIVNALPSTPTISAGGVTTFCDGESVILTSSTGTTYLWSTGETTQSITVTASGSYTVQVTDGNGCQSDESSDIDVTVNPLPTAPTISAFGSTTFCDGESVILTSGVGTTYLWSTGETSSSIVVTTPGSYSVQITDGNGCQSTSSASTTVIVNPIPSIPTITAGGPTTFCSAGGSVVLTSSATSGNLWSTGETTQSITVTTTGSYTVEQILSGCTSGASASTDVLVNPTPATPTITAASATTFCDGNSVILTSSASTGNLWSTGETTQSITVTTSGSYSVNVIDGPCTSAVSNTINVTVNPIPTIPTITAGGPTTFCSAGGSVVLTSSATSGNLWSTGETTQSITVTTTGSYTVEQILSGCTSGASASTDVLVNPTPATPTITAASATTFCDGNSVILTSSASSGNLWSTGETTQSITVTTSGSYSVNVIDGPCTSAVSNTINVMVNPIPTIPTITAGGPTTFCSAGGSVVLTSSATSGNLWSTGETTQSITVTTTGSYTVEQILSGCTSGASASTDVLVNPTPATPTITAASATTFCDGNSVILTSSASTGNLWSTGETTQSITVTTSGSYSVNVIDGPCTSAVSNTINVTVNPIPSIPTITAGGPTTFCSAGGSVVLTSSATSGNLWSTGETTQSITVTTTGSYSVEQILSGCTSGASASTDVLVNPTPATPIITAGGVTTFCDGNSVVLTSSATTGNLWSTGETTQSITVTTAGSYSVNVIDGPCTSAVSNTINVTVNPIPTTPVVTAGSLTTFCDGGSVVLTSSTASGNLWSTGETTQSITVTTAGSFTVEHIVLGCTSGPSAAVTVNVNPLPPVPTITASGSTTFCDGGSVILTSSATNGNLWSTGETTQSITVTTSGAYTVEATNGFGCLTESITSTNVTVNPIPAIPTITASGPTTFCSAGGSVVLTSSASTGNLWSTGETTQSITVTTTGSYTVEQILLGCTSGASASTSVLVNPTPATPTITAASATTFCDGNSVVLTSSSATGNLWSTGETTQSITVTTSGSYSVNVIDGPCTSAVSNTINVTVNPIPVVPTITAGGPTTFCSAGGSVVLTSSATSGNLWSTGETTQSITVTTTGSYTVEQILLGCTSGASASTSVLVNPTPATPTITAASATTFCDGNSVVLTSSSATGNLWSTGETTQSITVTTSGSYSVNVIDGPCTSAVSNTINVTVNPIPAVPTITASGATTFCNGNSVILTSSAATGNMWSTGETTQSITVAASGIYTVNTTSLGCTSPNASQTITVNPIPAAPVITAGGPTTFCAGGSVVLTSSVSTGNTWSTSETTPSITVSTSGSYTVTQTVLGCTSPASAPISVIVNTIPAVPTITASGVTTFCAGGSVTLTSSSTSNNLWSNGATTQSITVNSSGTFLVQVITNGCTSGTSAPKTVTVNALPATPTIVTGATESICAGSTVTLTSSSTGGNLWSTGEITQSITVSTAGSYTVTVTDGNGCTSPASTPTVVTVNPLPTAPVISMSGPITFCAGGSVTLSSSYGSGNLWSGGSTANSITVSSSGTYTVTHTDMNGCVSPASAAVNITVNPIPPAPVITASGPTTFCAGGSVTLSSSSSNGNSWSNSELTKDITVNTGGVYSVIYIDGNGCASPSSAPIVVSVLANPATPSITAGGATTICQGSYVTLTSSYTSGNLWSTGGMTQNINVTTSGIYTVTYTNGNGCTSTSNPITVTVIPVSAIPNISSSGSTTICDGASITLTSSDPNSTWSTGATSQTIVVTTSGSYSVIGNQTGCPSQPSAPVVVTVNPAPAAPIITPSGSTTICHGDELFLFTSGTGTNTWSTGYVGQVLAVTTSGNYWVTVQNAYGCSSSSVVVPVVVNPNPVVSVDPFEPLCTFAAPFTMANGSPAGGNYTGTGITGNIFYPAAAGVGTSIVTYTYSDVNGCSGQAQAIIEVNNCTGIKENEQATFALFPNPNNGQFKITSNGSPMDLIIIYDAQGKMVFNQSYSGTFALDFDLNDYSNGVYYIEISADKEIRERIPLVINH